MKKMKTVFTVLGFLVVFTATTCNNTIVRNLWLWDKTDYEYEYEYEYTRVRVHSSRNPQDNVYIPTALFKNGTKVAWWGEGVDAYIPDNLGFNTFTVSVCMSGASDFRPLTFPDTASLGNSTIEYYSIAELAQFEPDNTENAYTWHIASAVDNPTFRECFSYEGYNGKVLKLPKRFTIQK
jgi:hypothetical protein